ncbi:CCA tRNA nucleotidyltransferase [Marinilactibacillus sp. GCM10026970]|uniref:CCA tRNA nucleotidyltransferase n=1 Tax=Marinilactibacillus sp. GCM10026970 TaxID=3252642 RepID=UPI003605BDD2
MRNKLVLTEVFIKALPVLNVLEQAGFEAYFVGGSVRDAMLGKDVNDVDIATSAFPNEVQNLFKKTIDVGIEHGTVMVLWEKETYEITTFRTESTYQDFRRPDSVTFVRSLAEDLKRRDFTINALAMDKDGYITDLFNGTDDLNHQVIRAVGVPDERFGEDALRMMRATRFSAQLGFNIEEETVRALKKNTALLEHIAIERIQVEFIKMCLGQFKYKGLVYFIESNLYEFCPGLKKEALRKFSEIGSSLENERQIWTAYLLLDEYDDHQLNAFMKSWKLSNKLIQQVTSLFRSVKFRMASSADVLYIYRLGKELALETENILRFLQYPADSEAVLSIYESLPIYSKQDLAVTGKDLLKLTNAKAGKWLGDALNHIEEAVVLGTLNNSKQEIITWTKQHTLIPETDKN